MYSVMKRQFHGIHTWLRPCRSIPPLLCMHTHTCVCSVSSRKVPRGVSNSKRGSPPFWHCIAGCKSGFSFITRSILCACVNLAFCSKIVQLKPWLNSCWNEIFDPAGGENFEVFRAISCKKSKKNARSERKLHLHYSRTFLDYMHVRTYVVELLVNIIIMFICEIDDDSHIAKTSRCTLQFARTCAVACTHYCMTTHSLMCMMPHTYATLFFNAHYLPHDAGTTIIPARIRISRSLFWSDVCMYMCTCVCI